MTRLCLIRHAPTHAKTMVGWSDLPADCSDLDAFTRLRALLPADGHIVTSDLSRTIATAAALALPHPLLPPEPGLRELHFGAWELQSFTDIEAQDPTRIRAFWETPGDIRPPGGESWDDLHTRVHTTLDRLMSPRSTPLIVVSHFGPIVACIQRAEGLTAEEAFSHRIDNLSLTEIEITNGTWRLIRHNHRP